MNGGKKGGVKKDKFDEERIKKRKERREGSKLAGGEWGMGEGRKRNKGGKGV